MMRRSLPVLLLLALPALAQAPLPKPEASPAASVSQTIGMTEVSIDYHRPGVKGRTIWGGLVPWNDVWRAGANENTTLRVSHDAKVEGKTLAAGTYGLHLLPTPDKVTVIFSRNSTSWGSFHYDQAEDALRVDVTPVTVPFTEWLAYEFEDPTATSATCRLRWGEKAVPFRIAVDTPAIVVANARDNYLRDLPGFFWQGPANAATYCLQSGVELEQGLAWAEQSIGIQANFTNLNLKANLLEKLGRGAEAAPLREKALAFAGEADVNALGYQHLQAGKIDEAIRVFEQNAQRFPDSWNCWDSLAESLLIKGEKARAKEIYEKALAMAPADQKARIQGMIATIAGG